MQSASTTAPTSIPATANGCAPAPKRRTASALSESESVRNGAWTRKPTVPRQKPAGSDITNGPNTVMTTAAATSSARRGKANASGTTRYGEYCLLAASRPRAAPAIAQCSRRAMAWMVSAKQKMTSGSVKACSRTNSVRGWKRTRSAASSPRLPGTARANSQAAAMVSATSVYRTSPSNAKAGASSRTVSGRYGNATTRPPCRSCGGYAHGTLGP